MTRNSVGVKNLTCHTQLSSDIKPVQIPVNITIKHIKSVARNSAGVKNLTCHTQLSSDIKPVQISVNIMIKHIKSVA